MDLLIKKRKNIKGIVDIPTSKSEAIRKILIASLLNRTSYIYDVSFSNDVLTIINILKEVGIDIQIQENKLIIIGNTFKKPTTILNSNSSATVLRFIIPVLLTKFDYFQIRLNQDLLKRPLKDLFKFLKKENISYHLEKDTYTFKGLIKSKNIKLTSTKSSQYISSLYYILLANNNIKYGIFNYFYPSKEYVKLTHKIFKEQGIKVIKFFKFLKLYKLKNTFLETTTKIHTDFSQSIYFLILSMYFDIKISKLENFYNPDYIQFKYFKKFNIILDNYNGYYLKKENKKQKHLITLHFKNNPDLALPFLILAILNPGKYYFTGLKNLKIKESDRFWVIKYFLNALSIRYKEFNNSIYFKTSDEVSTKRLDIESKDHRVIMSYTVLKLIKENQFIVKNSKSVEKSYLDFFKTLKDVGFIIEEYEKNQKKN